MKIMLKNVDGEVFSIDLNPEDTFGTLRSKVFTESGIDLDISLLDFKGRRVSEKDMLGNFLENDLLCDSGVMNHTLGENDLTNQLIYPPVQSLECLVLDCGKSQGENTSTNFFALPSEQDRLHHWLLVCRRYDLLEVPVNTVVDQYVICEDHFIADHFVDSNRQSLKSDAIPTVFRPNQYPSTLGNVYDDSEAVGECEVLIREGSSCDEDNEAEASDRTADQLCRLCASSISDVVYIFSDMGKEQEIAKKINSCLPVTVKSTDPLPKQLCTPCVNKLNLCHEFAEACIQAQDKLRDMTRRHFFKSHSVVAPNNSDNSSSENAVQRKKGLELGLCAQKEDSMKLNVTGANNEHSETYCCPLCCEGSMEIKSSEKPVLNTQGSDVERGEVQKSDAKTDKILQNPDCNVSTTIWDGDHGTPDCDGSLEGSQETRDGDEVYNSNIDNEHKSSSNNEGKLCCRICGESFENTMSCLSHAASHFVNDFYPCSLCDLCFSTFPSFQTHCEKHQNESPRTKTRVSKRLSCNLCGKRFNTEKTLKNHSCGSSPRPFKCEECGKYFLTEVRLLFHQQIHQGGSAITCEYCGKMFSRENNLFDHVRLVHMGEKAHCCDQCGKTFQLKARLIAHQRVHTGERPFECDVCGGKFYDKATLKGHRVTHLDVKPFQCEKCGRCFARKTLFKQHTLGHLSEDCKRPRTYSCRICGDRVFSTYAKLIEHRKEVHPEAEMNEIDDSNQVSKPFKCEDCGKSFAYRVTLVAHRRNHTGELPFQCEYCPKRFSQKRSLVLHRRTHTGEKPFVCLECGKRFVQSAHLYSHTRLHTGEKPYACEVCGEAFRLKDVRDAHQRKHTGERPFKCTVCEKAFRTSHSYYQHMWIHQGKKPYPCTYCGKAFRRSNGLKIHIRIHTGEKPHTCDVCGRPFAQKQDMKKHRNLHVKGKS